MRRWWISDQHYNHPNIAWYCKRYPWFKDEYIVDGKWRSPEDAHEVAVKMNKGLTHNTNMRVKPGDKVICVGDVVCKGGEKGVKAVLHTKPAEILASLNGDWTVIEGNHDSQNGVKACGDFMSCRLGRYRVGVRHRPLFDADLYERWRDSKDVSLPAYMTKMSQWSINREIEMTRFCQKMYDFIICGHVHNSWHVKKIAGIWHVNVSVDANRFMPIDDSEVIQIFEKAKRGK